MSDSLEIVASSWFRQEFAELQEDQRKRINRKLMELIAKGWSAAMGDQTVKHLQDGIYELRVLGRGPAFRLLFFVVPGRRPRVVVVTTCAAKSMMKKRQRLEAEVERAKSRRAAWTAQNQNGEG